MTKMWYNKGSMDKRFWVGFVLVWTLILALLVYISKHNIANGETPRVTESPALSGVSALNRGVGDSLEIWLTRLMDYENCPVEGIIDSNNFRSYGKLCFQKATYLHYMAKFAYICMPFAEKTEWVNNLSDTDTQLCLAKQMILADKNAYLNWYTSTVVRDGLGKPPTVSLR